MTRKKRILLLDDDSDVVDAAANLLKDDYCIVKTSSPFEALSFVDAGRSMIDLILCDYSMPGMNGVEFVQQMRKIRINTPVILFSGMMLDEDFATEHMEFLKVLSKPFEGESLRREIAQILSKRRSDPPDFYKRYEGVLPHLEGSLDNLEKFLKAHGLNSLEGTSPEEVVKIHGNGDIYNIYMSWFYLDDLRCKIRGGLAEKIDK